MESDLTLPFLDAFSDVESRGGAPIRHFRPYYQSIPQTNRIPAALAADQRLFGLLNGDSGITITSSGKSGLLKTRTVASLASTLYTITSSIYCIPTGQLVGGSAAPQCASAAGRRRREVAYINDLVEEAKRQHEEKERFLRSIIAPNSVEKLTTTVLLDNISEEDHHRNTRDLNIVNPGLDSSQFNDDEANYDDPRNKRSFFNFFQMTTSVPLTNCSTTVVTTQVPLNLAGVSGSGSISDSVFTISSLNCIPVSLKACT